MMHIKTIGQFYAVRMAITLKSGMVNLYLSADQADVLNPGYQIAYCPIVCMPHHGGKSEVVYWNDRYWAVKSKLTPYQNGRSIRVSDDCGPNNAVLKLVRERDPMGSRDQ